MIARPTAGVVVKECRRDAAERRRPGGAVALGETDADVGRLTPPRAPKQLVTDVLAGFPGLSWEEIDLTEYPEVAGRYSIMSVPAVVIGGELAFARIPKRDALEGSIRAYIERNTT